MRDALQDNLNKVVISFNSDFPISSRLPNPQILYPLFKSSGIQEQKRMHPFPFYLEVLKKIFHGGALYYLPENVKVYYNADAKNSAYVKRISTKFHMRTQYICSSKYAFLSFFVRHIISTVFWSYFNRWCEKQRVLSYYLIVILGY